MKSGTPAPGERGGLRRRFRDSRGISLLEAVTVISMLGLLALVLFQMQGLVARQFRGNTGNAVVHGAMRQTLQWLPVDLLLAREVQVSGGVLTIHISLSDVRRQVEYFLDGGDLVRVLKDDGTGAILQRYAVAHSVTLFDATYQQELALVEYKVAAESKGGEPMQLSGAVRLRNAALWP